jgi:hypothetical protein
MRSSWDFRYLVGVGLIVVGGLLMLQTMGILDVGGLLWAALFAAAGIAFLFALFQDRSRWWAVIPGLTLLGLAAAIASGDLFPRFAAVAGGAIFLGSLALAFSVIFLLRPDFWWAIIPAGTLATLAVVTGVADRLAGVDSGGILFLGLAATFLILYLLPEGRGRQRWSIFPAAVLGLMGLGTGLLSGSVARLVWPAVLILLGLYFILRAGIGRRPA